MSINNLAEIPTSELVSELERRSVASLVCVVMPDDGAMTCNTRTFYSGNNFTLLGLAEAACDRMRCRIRGNMGPDPKRD